MTRGFLRAWIAVAAGATLALGGVLLAQNDEKQPLTLRERIPLTGPEFTGTPTPAPKEFRDMMRANQGLLAVDNTSENVGGAPNAGAGVTAFNGRLGKKLASGKDEDLADAAADVAALKENFKKIEAYFAERKSDDGVQLARSGISDLEAMEKAVQEKNKTAAVRAEIGVAVACRNCHIAHRVLNITMPMTFGVIG